MPQNWKITIEILRTTADVGKQGEVKEVSLSFAHNKLFPEWIAREYRAQPSKEEKKAKIYTNRFDIIKRLHEKVLEINIKQTGWHLSETVNPDWLVEKIRSKFHVTLLPEMIRLDEKHIKKAGKHTVHIDLSADAYGQIILDIR
jgi:ribosomal protein L9